MGASEDVDISDAALRSDLEEIEGLKMDISALEVEYKQVIESVKSIDGEVRSTRKLNDEIIASIKAHVRI
jgi:hypothetical protein